MQGTKHFDFVIPSKNHDMSKFISSSLLQNGIRFNFKDTVVANRTFSSVKPLISPSNVALNANQGTVLKSAHPEDPKTPPTW